MRQFDVCRNSGRNRALVPYLFAIQSNEFSWKKTHMVVPLLRTETSMATLGPTLKIMGDVVDADVFQMFAVPRDKLDAVVAYVDDEDNAFAFIAAIDRAISQGYS
jgi:hypothetical protein